MKNGFNKFIKLIKGKDKNIEKGSDNMKNKMPVIFIGHGSPLNMILDNDYTRDLSEFGKA
ncbi:hypothetical protein [Clostridium isatidis]|uniref:hypothetical protein n=1 Tax=Clostridium isatidis TaxID=182773 RepID=UPI003AAB40BC